MRQCTRLLNLLWHRRCRLLALTAAVAPVLLFGGYAAAADENWVVTKAITLPGGKKITAFDISFDNPVIGLYLLADRTNAEIQAVNTFTDRLLPPYRANPPFAGVVHNPDGSVNNDLSGPDGVFTVNNQEIWAGDGNSTVKVINLFTGQTTHVIRTGGQKRADEGCFDPRDQIAMMANDADSPPFVSLISTKTYGIQIRIRMDGTSRPRGGLVAPRATNGIEQCQWDFRTGNFYVNLPEVNGKGDDTSPGAVLEISPRGKILNNWGVNLSTCAGPQGMAIGPDNQILLGCNNPNKTFPSTVIIHNSNAIGAPVIFVPHQDGADEVWYNEGSGEYFLARGGGSNPQKLGIIDLTLDPNINDRSVGTGLPNTSARPHGTNHSVAADPIFNQVFMPISSTSASTICGRGGGSNLRGCIAVFKALGTPDPPGPID